MHEIGCRIITDPAAPHGQRRAMKVRKRRSRQADIDRHALAVIAVPRHARGFAPQHRVGMRRTIAGNDLDGAVVAEPRLQRVQQIHQARMHRIDLARIMVAQHMVDLRHGGAAIAAVAPVIDMQTLVGMKIVEGQSTNAGLRHPPRHRQGRRGDATGQRA